MTVTKLTGRTGVQSHLTIAFPIKSPADAKALAETLPPLAPDLARAADAIGTVHYARLVVTRRCLFSPTLTARAERSSKARNRRSAAGRPDTDGHPPASRLRGDKTGAPIYMHVLNRGGGVLNPLDEPLPDSSTGVIVAATNVRFGVN